MAAVKPIDMNRGEEAALEPFDSLLVKQTRKGWFQECLGCEAKTEFRIATMQNPTQDIMYAIEESSCCLRTFCPHIRPYTMTLSAGGTPGGAPIATYKSDMRCPVNNYKCCCYQEIVTLTPSGQNLGSVKETCWYCVPNFAVRRADGTHEYDLHMPTCCGGLCVDCFAEGCCSCRIPFYLFPPGSSGNKDEQLGSIVKIWSGISKELFTDADNFEVKFPANSDVHSKARLVGATFFVNHLFFETQRGKMEVQN